MSVVKNSRWIGFMLAAGVGCLLTVGAVSWYQGGWNNRVEAKSITKDSCLIAPDLTKAGSLDLEKSCAALPRECAQLVPEHVCYTFKSK